MSERSIRTLLGDISPDQLGPTHGHEHVLFSPAPRFGDELQRTEHDLAIRELESFRAAGGGGLIDATVEELGRDPAALAGISAQTGVHVVAATGHTAQQWWWERSDPSTRSREELIAEMSADLTVGIGDTGVQAGVIKIGTSLDHITEAETRVMEAAATVHWETGAAITTHTTAGTVPREQASFLLESRVDPSRLCIGHLDRRMVWEDHLAIARTGVYLGYDQICKERHDPDVTRAEFVARLVAEGFGDRILLGSDLARRNDLFAWQGSPGLAYLLTGFVPLLHQQGLTDEDVARILVDNPRHFLAWA